MTHYDNYLDSDENCIVDATSIYMADSFDFEKWRRGKELIWFKFNFVSDTQLDNTG